MAKDTLKPSEWEDKDLKTSEHDDIMIRFANIEVWNKIFKTKFGEYPLLDPRSMAEPSRVPKFKDLRVEEIKLEHPILVEEKSSYTKKLLVGFIDILLRGRMGLGDFQYTQEIGCEIKAKENNLGAAIRQVKRYKFYSGIGAWIVISPWDYWNDILAPQFIYWLPTDIERIVE